MTEKINLNTQTEELAKWGLAIKELKHLQSLLESDLNQERKFNIAGFLSGALSVLAGPDTALESVQKIKNTFYPEVK